MNRILAVLVALGALLVLPVAARRAEDAPAPAARTVILVRHAEKDPQAKDPRDPGLSDAGAARAAELARVLGASRATHVYTSELARTRDTVAPLAKSLGVASEALPAAKQAETGAKLDALPAGSVAIVCGHSNTLPRVAEHMGVAIDGLVPGPGGTMLPDEAYDRVYVVTRPASGPATCVELRYGAPCEAKTPSAGK